MHNIHQSLSHFTKRVGTTNDGSGVYEVSIPKPPFGSSCYLIEEKGVYQFFRGEGALIAVSCTHVGVGTVEIYDGLTTSDGSIIGGPLVYKANPQTMCLWILNAGLNNGLVVKALGGSGVPVFLTVSWLEA